MSYGEGVEACWCLVVRASDWDEASSVHIPIGKTAGTNERLGAVRVSTVAAGIGVAVEQELGSVGFIGLPVALKAVACHLIHCNWCGAVLGSGSEWHFPVVAGVSEHRAIARVAFEAGWTTNGEDRWYCPACELGAPICPACLAGDQAACEGKGCIGSEEDLVDGRQASEEAGDG